MSSSPATYGQPLSPREAECVELRHYVILTEPNAEFRARDFLIARGFKPYVPLEDIVTIRSMRSFWGTHRRKVEGVRPLFRGYLFLPLNIAWSFGPLYEAPGLKRPNPFLMHNDCKVIATDDDIELIKRI